MGRIGWCSDFQSWDCSEWKEVPSAGFELLSRHLPTLLLPDTA